MGKREFGCSILKIENLKKFEDWWKSRVHKRQKIKGLSLSEKTLKCYLRILSKVPDIEINKETNPYALIDEIRNWLEANIGEGKNFKTKYPQLIFAIRTYIKMFESDEYPSKINHIAKIARLGLTSPTTKDVKGTQLLFMSKVLTKQQIRDIITHTKMLPFLPHDINKDKMVLFFQLLYDTGCRISEIASIKIKDIDFNNKTIQIIGKGKYIRKVEFSQQSLDLLMKLCRGLEDEDLVFGWNVETMKRYFKEVVKEIRKNFYKKSKVSIWLEKVSPHWFRHSRATHLAIVWKDVIKLKDYMGWSDIKMAEVYVTNLTILPSEILAYKSTNLWED
jgi:integrase